MPGMIRPKLEAFYDLQKRQLDQSERPGPDTDENFSAQRIAGGSGSVQSSISSVMRHPSVLPDA